jgi:O-phosphoseryl-tRNA(Cys) synthetase
MAVSGCTCDGCERQRRDKKDKEIERLRKVVHEYEGMVCGTKVVHEVRGHGVLIKKQDKEIERLRKMVHKYEGMVCDAKRALGV